MESTDKNKSTQNDLRKNRIDSIINKSDTNSDNHKSNIIVESENSMKIKKSKYKHGLINNNCEPVALIQFRRGLRLQDHSAINAAQSDIICSNNPSSSILCLFNFDPSQVGPNDYKSTHCVKQMVQSLEDLNNELDQQSSKLQITQGNSEISLLNVLDSIKTIKCVQLHSDVTPFSIERDILIKKVCDDQNVKFKSYWDDLMTLPGSIKSNSDTQQRVFKPFHDKAKQIKVKEVKQLEKNIIFSKHILNDFEWVVYKDNGFQGINNYLNLNDNLLHQDGGRTKIIKRLENNKQKSDLKSYDSNRDFPSLPTANISAALKFGVISIREAYNLACTNNYSDSSQPKSNGLTRELYTREFMYHTTQIRPNLLSGKCYNDKWDNQPYTINQQYWLAWTSGTTGIPLVDAAMRQLNRTGFMPNRVRMVVCMLLSKNMNICWRMGERQFATHLFDQDASVNNGCWQQTLGFGPSPLEQQRVMNPWTQQEKFDPQCVQVKEWVPELVMLHHTDIHNWRKKCKIIKDVAQPEPVIDVSQSRQDYLDRTKKQFATFKTQ